MESSDLELSTKRTWVNQIRENYKRQLEKIAQEKAARGNDGDAKKTAKKNAEKMRMVRRHKEWLMRHLRQKTEKKKKKKSESESESESECFTSDSSDEEMKIAKEQVKRLMEKAIAIPEKGDATKIEDSKAEIEDSKAEIEDETMFPRRRGRFIRYLRRQRSDPAAFQMRENMTSTLTWEESFMSYSDDSVE